jgi:hypothetical protein
VPKPLGWRCSSTFSPSDTVSFYLWAFSYSEKFHSKFEWQPKPPETTFSWDGHRAWAIGPDYIFSKAMCRKETGKQVFPVKYIQEGAVGRVRPFNRNIPAYFEHSITTSVRLDNRYLALELSQFNNVFTQAFFFNH